MYRIIGICILWCGRNMDRIKQKGVLSMPIPEKFCTYFVKISILVLLITAAAALVLGAYWCSLPGTVLRLAGSVLTAAGVWLAFLLIRIGETKML